MQPTMPLQKTAAKATSKTNWKIYYDFSSGYLTFAIFNNTAFFGTIQKTDEK